MVFAVLVGNVEIMLDDYNSGGDDDSYRKISNSNDGDMKCNSGS